MYKIIAIGNPEFPFKMLCKDQYEIIYIIDKDQHSKKKFVTGNPLIIVESFEEKNLRWVLEAICKERHIDAIVNFDEKNQLEINKIIKTLNYHHINLKSIEIANDKLKTRKAISELKIGHIPYIELNKQTSEKSLKDFIEENGFPLIIKNRFGTGSSNLFLVNSINDYNEISENINDNYIAEKYIPGNEFSAEYITLNGKHCLMAITDKSTTEFPNFVECQHIVNGEGYKYRNIIDLVMQQFLNHIELNIGISHTEFKIYNEEIYIIETHVRPGGDCIMDLIECASEVNPYFLYINCLLENDEFVNKMILKLSHMHKSSGIRYIRSKSGVIKEITVNDKKINSIDGYVRMYLPYKVGEKIHEFQNSFDRDGWIMAVGNSKNEVINALNDIEKEIIIEIEA
ncbi:MAG: ATP-grasp domain-containing protein [Finegoldia magna]|nr:ATP-grasp domain-containing protein [Finegoldia magna]